MNKILILKAFKKARIEKQKEGIKKPSQTDLSTELSNFIDETENFSLGERSFRDYYNEAKNLSGKDDDISIKQLHVINGLCRYLGYDSYKVFISNNKGEVDKPISKNIGDFIKRNKVILIIAAILMILIFNSITRQRWMIWQDDHYIEVKFDTDKYDFNQLKLYKEERILHFKQIIPDCNTKFFKENGSENLWYGKNKDRELEYFTDLGLHPETGKTLKKITLYMIKKYICKTYNK